MTPYIFPGINRANLPPFIQIEWAAAKIWGLKLSDLRGPSHKTEIIKAKHAVRFYMVNELGLTEYKAAKLLKINIQTAYHSTEAAQNLLTTDSEFFDRLTELKEKLKTLTK